MEDMKVVIRNPFYRLVSDKVIVTVRKWEMDQRARVR